MNDQKDTEPKGDKGDVWEIEFPSAEQLKSHFVTDMEQFDAVVGSFPENIQTAIEGILYRLEDADEVDSGLLRQLATIFQGNSQNEEALRIGKWIRTIAEFADFFREAIDVLIDASLGLAPGEAEPEGAPKDEPKEEPKEEPAK
jgi:hypothetical protein